MIVWGPGFAASPHRHHCVQLLMVMDGTLRIRRGPPDNWIQCEAALIRPSASHEVDARGSTMLVAFVDSASELGAALSAQIKGDIWRVPKKRVLFWRAALGQPPNKSRIQRWVQKHLLRKTRLPHIHPAIERIVAYLRRRLGGSRDLSLAALSAIAGLSRSRLMHLFTQSLGVPIRPYILWLRLQRAAGAIGRGATPTEAAYCAGFADAAHMSRTFRRMLGNTPKQVAHRRALTRALPLELGGDLPQPGQTRRRTSGREK
jgi:AraC-like DNA-binding protein